MCPQNRLVVKFPHPWLTFTNFQKSEKVKIASLTKITDFEFPQNPKIYEKYFAEQMQNEQFRKEYEAFEPEFAIIQAIIDARQETGLTQRELSERTGIAQSDISKLENGNANPSIRTLKRLAEAMGKQLKISNMTPQTEPILFVALLIPKWYTICITWIRETEFLASLLCAATIISAGSVSLVVPENDSVLSLSVSATQDRSSNFSKNYKLTRNNASDLVAVAQAQLGKPGKQLGYSEQ